SVMLFSSRSRRQSFCGDWSSDVCSSDLLLHVLLASYEEQQLEREKRVVLHLKPSLAPVKAAVLPLLRNRPQLVEVARRLASELRSEEHTSELQSRENLVCRLLLEKKK